MSVKLFVYLFTCVTSLNFVTGQAVRIQYGHTSVAASVSFYNKGTDIISVGLDKQIILWDINSGKEIKRWSNFMTPSNDLAINNKDNSVAVFDGTSICVIDTKTDEQKWIRGGHFNDIRSLKFSSDGNFWLR